MSQIILFDLDGTLTDSGEGITKSVQYALSHFGIMENDLEKLGCFVGPPLHQQFMEYAGFSQEQAWQAVEFYRERYSSIGIYENRLYPKVKELLELLAVNDTILGVASSKPEVYVEQILKHFEIDSYFQVVVGSELDGRRTRKAEVIEEALRRLGMNRARDSVLMVGDREHDVKGAKDCGIQCIGVTYGYGSREELEKAGAVYIADTVEDLGILASPNDEETTENVESVRVFGREGQEHRKKHRRGTEKEDRPPERVREAEGKEASPNAKDREETSENGTARRNIRKGSGNGKKRRSRGEYSKAPNLMAGLWRAVYPVLVYYGISLLVLCGMIVVFLLRDRWAGLPENPARVAQAVQEYNLYQILITAAISAVLMFLLYRRDEQRRQAGYLGGVGLESGWNPPVMWISAVALGIVGSQLGNDLIAILRLRELFPGYDTGSQMTMEGQPVWLLLLAVGILAPVAEELVFRGLLFGRLKDWMNPGTAVLISSLIFGIYHGNMVQLVYAFLLGSLFAFMYYRTGTLWAAVAGHVAANMWSLFGSPWLTALFENKPVWAAVKLLVEVLLAVIPAYWIFGKRQKAAGRKKSRNGAKTPLH